jgi:hypothetical protein
MTAFIDLPQTLASQIEDIIDGTPGLTCLPDRYTFTAGEPAAPSGSCNAVWVWIGEIFNMGNQTPFARQADEVGCVIRPGVTLNVRVDVCYEETQDDATDTQHAATADCFHGLLRAIWCGLADLWASGELLGFDCRHTTLSQFTVGPRLGAVVSATLQISGEYDCSGAAS